MIMLPILFLALLLAGCRFQKNEDYLSLKQTTCINGLFFLCVFFRHVSFLSHSGQFLNVMAQRLDNYAGQLIVVPFLLYSGYGIAESIRTKPDYVRHIPSKKIFRTWLQFAVYVLIFLIMQLNFGSQYPSYVIVLSLVGWLSVGNLNWYIFAILMLWLGTWISFSIFKKGIKPYLAMTVYTLAYILVLRIVNKDSNWFDTVIAYNIGMFISLLKPVLQKIYNNTLLWCILTLSSLTALVFLSVAFRNSFILMALKTGFLSAALVLISMRMKIGNPITYAVGKNLLAFYLVHYIPIAFLRHFVYMKNHPYIYALSCALITVILVFVYVKLLGIIRQKKSAHA